MTTGTLIKKGFPVNFRARTIVKVNDVTKDSFPGQNIKIEHAGRTFIGTIIKVRRFWFTEKYMGLVMECVDQAIYEQDEK